MRLIFCIYICFSLLNINCNDQKITSECVDHNTCEDEQITRIYQNELATVEKFVISPTNNPDNYIFILKDSDNKVLVPCPTLPDSIAVHGMEVRFSGLKTSCCQLIAKENWRIGIGCKLDIKSVRKENR